MAPDYLFIFYLNLTIYNTEFDSRDEQSPFWIVGVVRTDWRHYMDWAQNTAATTFFHVAGLSSEGEASPDTIM